MFENVELPLLPLDEEDEAVESHALQNIDGVLDHPRTTRKTIPKCKIPLILFLLPILVSNILPYVSNYDRNVSPLLPI
jgi:hypothetical protein